MRDDRQVRIPLGYEDLAEPDVLPLLVLPKEPRVDRPRVDALRLELSQHTVLVPREGLNDLDAGFAQCDHRDRVADEGVGGRERDPLAVGCRSSCTALSAGTAMTPWIGSPAQRAITRKAMWSNSDWKLWFVNTKSNSPRPIIASVSWTVGPIRSRSGTPLADET
jgi:hypothetical protein